MSAEVRVRERAETRKNELKLTMAGRLENERKRESEKCVGAELSECARSRRAERERERRRERDGESEERGEQAHPCCSLEHTLRCLLSEPTSVRLWLTRLLRGQLFDQASRTNERLARRVERGLQS